MAVLSITKVVMHPQWGVPMEYHTLTRIEQDLPANESYFVFASYYNEAVHKSGGSPMSTTAIRLEEAVPAAPEQLLQSIVDKVDGEFEGGTIAF